MAERAHEEVTPVRRTGKLDTGRGSGPTVPSRGVRYTGGMIRAAIGAMAAAGLALAFGLAVGGRAVARDDFAVPPPKLPFGIVAFDLNGAVPPLLRRLGVGVVRGSCGWNALEPAPGVFDWRCADNVIADAQTLGLRSYMTVSCTPAWANGGAGCSTMPADIVDWYDFVTAFVTRYTKYDTVLGVWNEPNFELRDTPSGRNYALLFVNASNARNKVNAAFPIAGPETSHHAVASGYFRETMDQIVGYGALDSQDIVAVHWYPDGPPLADYLDAVHALAGSHEVWLSETGLATADLPAQAAFYDRVLRMFAAAARPWWTHVIFYRLWDGLDCCTEAIVRGDFTPKPAFDLYRAWNLKPLAVPRYPPK